MITRALQFVLVGITLACRAENPPSRATTDSAAAPPPTSEIGNRASVMVTHATPSDPSRTAALITAMMLRFPQDSLPLGVTPPPNQKGELGSTALILMPEGRRIVGDEIVEWFHESPKPLIASPTYIRGPIAVWSGLNTPFIQHELQNQLNVMAEYQREYGLVDDASVLLNTGSEVLVFPFSHFREWASTYAIAVGWQLRRADPGAPVKAQLVLIAPGLKRSPGWPTFSER